MKPLSLTRILEDLNIHEMSSANMGLYAFLQAMNKCANLGPVPMPTIDIINDPSIEVNPGPFSFSRSSFKIKVNPKAHEVSFEGAQHDFFHALTVNLAKHFARLRPQKTRDKAFFLTPSRANVAKNIKPKDLRASLSTDLQIDNTKTHFERSLNNNGTSFELPHQRAQKEFGGKGTVAGLPQYDLEEYFGNYLRDSFNYAVKESRPISDSQIDVGAKSLRALAQPPSFAVFKSEKIDQFIDKFTDYLKSVMHEYNTLLARYKKQISLRDRYDHTEEGNMWDRFSSNAGLMRSIFPDEDLSTDTSYHFEKRKKNSKEDEA